MQKDGQVNPKNVKIQISLSYSRVFWKWRVHNIVSLNNIYLLTSHTYRDNHDGTEDKIAVRIKSIKMNDGHTVQLHLLVHTQHEQSAVAPLLVTSAFKHTGKTTKTRGAANSFKTPDQRQVWLKKTKVLDSGKLSSLTIYTANNTEMVNVDGSQHRAGWYHRKHC